MKKLNQFLALSNEKVCISCGQTLLSIIPPIIHSTNNIQGE